MNSSHPAATLCAALLAVCGLNFSLAAAPVNDNFASRVNLGNTATINTTGNNTGATLEAGEVNPGGYGGASVWYQWTAPSTGWVTLHTVAGSAANGLDTVLALYSGTGTGGLASVQMLGFNDESIRSGWSGYSPHDFPVAIYPDDTGPSRLVFYATAGQVCQIAVHGWDVAVGAFELHIASEPTPGLQVTALSTTPSSVDVTSAAQSFSEHVTFVSSSPLDLFGPDFIYVRIVTPDGSEGYTQWLTVANKTAGDLTNGTYASTESIPRYNPPGQWILSGHGTFGGKGYSWTPSRNDVIHDDYLIPPPVAGTLTVINSGPVDSVPPALTAFSISPTSVNNSAGDQIVTVTMTLTDSLAGVDLTRGSVQISNADYSGAAWAQLSDAQLISGTPQNGVYEIALTVPSSLPSGTYYWDVNVDDKARNDSEFSGRFDSNTVDPLLAAASLTVTGSPPPANDNFSARSVLGSALPVSASGSNIAATMESGEDNLGGSAKRSVWHSWAATSTGWVSVDTVGSTFDTLVGVFTGSSVGALQRVGFNDNSGRKSDSSGPYPTDSRLYFKAQAGTTYQIAVYGSNWTSAAGVGSYNLHITSAIPPHEVTAMTITPSAVNVTSGSQNVTIDITVQSVSPLQYLNLEMWKAGSPAQFNGPTVLDSSNRISGNDTNGTYRLIMSIPRYMVPSSRLFAVFFYDVLGQSYRHSNGADTIPDDVVLSPSASTSLTVINTGTSDTVAPALVSVSGFPASVNVSGSEVTFDVDITVTDALSGFDHGSIGLVGSSGFFNFGGNAPIYPIHILPGGNAQNGTYRVSFTIPQGTLSGTYYPSIGLFDATFNGSNYSDDPLRYSTPIPPAGVLSIEVINTSSGYSSWKTSKFSPAEMADPNISGSLADAEKDGILNAVEYALGLEPKTNNPTPWQAGTHTVGPAQYQTISFSVPETFPADATLIAEESDSLESTSIWITLATKVGSAAWTTSNGGVVSVGATSGARIPITVRSPNAMGGANPLGFMHLRVQVP
jgi:hypothetical protein